MSTPELPRPTPFDLIVRALYVLIPVIVSSCLTYKQGQYEASAGYTALMETTLKLQAEVKELHEVDSAQDTRTAKLEEVLRTAEEPQAEPVQVFDAGHPHILAPPPASLEAAVERQEAL